jgi:hypothetical protein
MQRSVLLSSSARSSVLLSSGAAVCGSAATRCSVSYHLRAVEARLPDPAPRHRSQYDIHNIAVAGPFLQSVAHNMIIL